MPQSCSLTLRNRNPNQIVRLHFMHQNWPKRVIETSIWDIECSNPSKYHKFALILVIFSNICPTKRLPWTLTEWVCVPEVEINDCIAYYMVLFNSLHNNLKSTVFTEKQKFNGLFLWNFIIRDFVHPCLIWGASLTRMQNTNILIEGGGGCFYLEHILVQSHISDQGRAEMSASSASSWKLKINHLNVSGKYER